MDEESFFEDNSPNLEIEGLLPQPYAKDILDLPNELLFEIFSYCDVPSLLRLCCVCRRFKLLISEDCVWFPRLKHLTIVKNIHYKPQSQRKPASSSTQSRSLEGTLNISDADRFKTVDHPPASMKLKHAYVKLKEYFKLSFNWCEPQYSEKIAVRHKNKQMPCLAYDGDYLWLSTQNKINCYRCSKKMSEIYSRKLVANHANSDVSHFVTKGFISVGGCRDGSVYIWNNETAKILCQKRIHASETQCVDFNPDVILSGSRDCTVKLLPFSQASLGDPVNSIINMQERIWSLSLCPGRDKCAIGTAGVTSDQALTIWNLNKHCLIHNLNENHKKGAGVLDMKFETPNILFTCGYDTYLRMWDLRNGKCVKRWEEPFDSTLVTLQTDYNNSLLTGSSNNALTILWDKRVSRPVQLYHAKRGNTRSPVYSLAFDSQSMYVALDLTLNIMNFNC